MWETLAWLPEAVQAGEGTRCRAGDGFQGVPMARMPRGCRVGAQGLPPLPGFPVALLPDTRE